MLPLLSLHQAMCVVSLARFAVIRGLLSKESDLQMLLAIEAMADGGVLCALPRRLAQRLAAQTMIVCDMSDYVLFTSTSHAKLSLWLCF